MMIRKSSQPAAPESGAPELAVSELAASESAAPWNCGPPLSPDCYERLVRRSIFECCRWNNQSDGRPLLCSFPLVLNSAAWEKVARLASDLASETLAAEQELIERPELHDCLGLPRALVRCLRRICREGPTCAGPRVMRFDFHWTAAGWRISEANTDVASGFIEASGVTQMFAEFYPNCQVTGDPAGLLSEAIQSRLGSDGRVGLMHLTVYVDDRQIMEYIARRLEDRGIESCLLSPAQIRWRAGILEAACNWYSGPLQLLFRFLPAEWLPRLPRPASWERLFAGGRTPICNPGFAVLTQSKRFPLVWERLSTSLSAWRSLLSETCSPDTVSDLERGDWVIKPALGHEGHNVRIRLVTDANIWQRAVRDARKHPHSWAAQRLFQSVPLPTPEGHLYPCLGVYVIDGRVAGCYGRMLRPWQKAGIALELKDAANDEPPRPLILAPVPWYRLLWFAFRMLFRFGLPPSPVKGFGYIVEHRHG